jgi:hypothetical protein
LNCSRSSAIEGSGSFAFAAVGAGGGVGLDDDAAAPHAAHRRHNTSSRPPVIVAEILTATRPQCRAFHCACGRAVSETSKTITWYRSGVTGAIANGSGPQTSL